MNALQTEIEDIKDALAAIEDNGERSTGETGRLRARLASLEVELAQFNQHPPRT